MDPVDAFDKLKKTAEENKKAQTRVMGAMAVNDAVRQGDVYIKLISEVPREAVKMDPPNPQLVPGTSRGSQHCITPDTFGVCTLYVLPGATPLQGPIIEARDTFKIGHPEHGDFVFLAGIYAVSYQRRFADDIRRVVD